MYVRYLEIGFCLGPFWSQIQDEITIYQGTQKYFLYNFQGLMLDITDFVWTFCLFFGNVKKKAKLIKKSRPLILAVEAKVSLIG